MWRRAQMLRLGGEPLSPLMLATAPTQPALDPQILGLRQPSSNIVSPKVGMRTSIGFQSSFYIGFEQAPRTSRPPLKSHREILG
jgi:hypothetical protein